MEDKPAVGINFFFINFARFFTATCNKIGVNSFCKRPSIAMSLFFNRFENFCTYFDVLIHNFVQMRCSIIVVFSFSFCLRCIVWCFLNAAYLAHILADNVILLL